jgi:Nitroreductase
MDFMDLCLRRQSCRNFADKPVEHDKLVKCVEAARLTPSGCNSQPWSFVVVEDPKLVPEVAQCAQQMGINEYISGAKAFIVILEEHAVLMPGIRKILDSQYFAKGDLGAAVVTLCYAAEAQGLGTCILGVYDREKLGQLLNIPLAKQYGGLIAVGYAAEDKVRNKARKPLEEIARFV